MMPNMSQDNKNNIPDHPAKDGRKWPISVKDFDDLENEAAQFVDNHADKSSLIINQENEISHTLCKYLLLFMLMESLSKDFIEKTIFNDFYIQLHPLIVLYSIAIVMGEDFALQFISRQFTSEDVYKAITDKILAENAEQANANDKADEAQLERIRELSDKTAEVTKKINESEKTIQAIQAEHNNLIDFLDQEIAQVRDYYEDMKTNNEKHSQEISNKNIELANANIIAAEAKKDAVINKLQAEIDCDKLLQEKDRENYEEKIKAKDEEINNLNKQIDEYKKLLLEPVVEDGTAEDSGDKNLRTDKLDEKKGEESNSFLHEPAPMPKGCPDRKFSKKQTLKRKSILFDAIDNCPPDQYESIADAYTRGLPYDELKRMYDCKNPSKEKLRTLERALLKLTYGLD